MRTFSTVFVVCILAIIPFATSAATVSELQAQLAALLAQIAQMQATNTQQNATNAPANAQTNSSQCPNLTRTLARGYKGSDVAALQRFLIAQGHLAQGNDSGFFGALTEAAVKKFQCKHMSICSGSPSTTGYGLVGAKTRAMIAQVCKSPTTPQPTPQPTPLPQPQPVTPPPPPPVNPQKMPCSFGPQTLPHGVSVTAYESLTVPAGQSCKSQVRTCSDGVLSGTYQHSNCVRQDQPLPTATLQITPGSQTINPHPVVGGTVFGTLTASGGSAPYVWTVAKGALPPGYLMNSAGTFSGNVTVPGTCVATTRATNTKDNYGEATYTWIIDPAPVTGPVASCSLSPSTTTGKPGDPLTISFTSQNAEHVLEHYHTKQGTSGTVYYTIQAGTTHYTFYAVGTDGIPKPCATTVTGTTEPAPTGAPSCSLTPSTTQGTVGQPLSITFSSQNAAHVLEHYGTQQPTSGKVYYSILAGTNTYTFYAVTSDGVSKPCTATVTGGAAPAAPSCALTPNKTSGAVGEILTISFTSQNAAHVLEHYGTKQGTSGSVVYNIQSLGSNVYTFYAVGSDGTPKACTTTVTGVAAAQVPSCSLTPSVSSGPVGSPIAISYTSQNAVHVLEHYGTQQPTSGTMNYTIGAQGANTYTFQAVNSAGAKNSCTAIVTGTQITSSNNKFYVSPSGSDSADGSIGAPFKTIEKAQARVREIRTTAAGDITVYLRGGTYALSQPLVFGASDSGVGSSKIIYTSYPGEKAIISGGTPVTGFTTNGPLHYAEIHNMPTRQLYTNASMANQPQPVRFPANSFFKVKQYNLTAGSCDGTLIYPHKAKAISSIDVETPSPLTSDAITGLVGSELVILKAFSQSRLNVQSATALTPNVVRLTFDASSSKYEGCNFDTQQEHGYRAYFERTPNFFANPTAYAPQPGSFTYKNFSLYFYARPEDGVFSNGVVIPRLEKLVSMDGAQNIQFDSITFSHTKWNTPTTDGYAGGQNGRSGFCAGFGVVGGAEGCVMPAVIEIRNSKNIAVTKSTISHAGAQGMIVDRGSSDIVVSRNTFANIAGVGLYVGTFDVDAQLATRRISIDNNVFQYIGRMYDAGAILAGYIVDSVIDNNSIFDVGYTGISTGWFGQGNLPPSNSKIRNNNIGYTNLRHGDGAGIYLMLGSKGTVVSGNYIHHITSYETGFNTNVRHGLYFDQMVSNVTADNNQIQTVSYGVFIQNQVDATGDYRAKNNTVTNLWVSDVVKPIYSTDYDPSNTVQFTNGVNNSIIQNSGPK